MTGDLRQEWTWRDMFRSIGLAFSFSRLMTGLIGLIVAGAIDLGLVKAAQAVGEHVGDSKFMGWLADDGFGYLRMAFAIFLFLFFATAIAYSVKGELLEGEGAGAGESIGFAFKKFGAIFWTPVLFWVYIALMAIFGGIWFIIGWIPVVGPAFAAAGWLFVFLFAVLGAMGFVAFLFSFFLSPSIIAVRQEGALDAVLDTIDLMRGKGAFWVSILVLFGASLVAGPFLHGTTSLTYKAANWVMEEDFRLTVKAMPEYLKPPAQTYIATARMYWPGETVMSPSFGPVPGVRSSRLATSGQPETRHKVAGWFLGLWMIILGGFCASFTLGAVVSAGTLTYLIVREEEEFLEPVIEGPPPAAADAKKDEAPAAKSEDKAEEKKEEKKDEKKDEGKKDKKKK